MTKETDVIIVGGAVAGAALACALAKHNIRVLVIDRRKEPASMNRGDGLQPRSLEILEQWGVLSSLQELPHIKSYGIELHHRMLKKLMKIDLKPLTSTSFNYMINIPHREIEQCLLNWADTYDHIDIVRGSSVEHLLYNEQGNVIGVNIKKGNEYSTYHAKMVVAADGAQSFIRKHLKIEAKREVYDHELVVLHLPRPASFQGDLRTQVHLHRDGAVVLIPLPNQQMRITVVVPSGDATTWRKYSDSELMHQLTRRVPSLANTICHREGEHVYKMVRMHAQHYHASYVALIGDAAHLTHASSGQGMNMAIQDADILSQMIAKCFNEKVSIQEALTLYEQIRKPINEEIIARSNFMSSIVYTPNQYLHTIKILGIFSTKLIPGLSRKISSKIAVGISGIDQKNRLPKL